MESMFIMEFKSSNTDVLEEFVADVLDLAKSSHLQIAPARSDGTRSGDTLSLIFDTLAAGASVAAVAGVIYTIFSRKPPEVTIVIINAEKKRVLLDGETSVVQIEEAVSSQLLPNGTDKNPEIADITPPSSK
jgi:hypothetical protein